VRTNRESAPAQSTAALETVSPSAVARIGQYALVSENQYDALHRAQTLAEERKAANVTVAFTGLEDVLGSEYVGPIGIGTLPRPASCGEATVSELQVTEHGATQKGVDTACQDNEQANLKVVFDTGSTNLWMASDLCNSPCKDTGRNWYDHKTSTTYSASEKYLRITFGTANLAGPVATDRFRIGPFTLKDQDFGMIEEAGGSTFSQMPLEGIVGLGFPAMASAGAKGRLPFFDNVIKQGLLEHNEFAFYFSKTLGKDGGNAIFWGGVDKRLYEGDIRMFPVSQPFYWSLDLHGFRLGSEDLSLHQSLLQRQGARGDYDPELRDSIPASTMSKLILDTGTTYFTAAGALYDQLNEKLPSGLCTDTKDYPPLVYTLKDVSGQLYELKIPSTEYMISTSGVHCRLAFMELSVDEKFGPAMLLGEVFMRSYFTVFDRGDGKPENARLGFGRAKHSHEFDTFFSPGSTGILYEETGGPGVGVNGSFLAPKA